LKFATIHRDLQIHSIWDFSEIKDNISPTVQRIGLKTLSKDSRINHQFGFFEFTPSRVQNEYTVSKVIEVHGKLGVLLMGYDRLNGASNRNGIPHLRMDVDSVRVIDITIDKVPFAISRDVLCYRDYQIKARENKSFRKLYIDDGNELEVFKNQINRGIIHITDTLIHDVQITLNDAHGNTSVVSIKLKGTYPEVHAIGNDENFKPFRHMILDNTLVFMGKKADNNGYFAHVYANRMSYELSSGYYVNDYSVYLWDLRTGIPDSIELCGEMIYPKLEMTVPSNTEFRYFKDEFDLHFYSQDTF
jgi:hypothetical protein